MSRPRTRQQQEKEWEFYSFPVLFAFFAGMFIATLLFPLAFFVFIISLFGVSFCSAHAISHWWRRRTTDRKLQQAEEDERERRALAARAATGQNEAAAAAARRRRRRRS